jgi:hypothetical protein
MIWSTFPGALSSSANASILRPLKAQGSPSPGTISIPFLVLGGCVPPLNTPVPRFSLPRTIWAHREDYMSLTTRRGQVAHDAPRAARCAGT